MKLTINEIAEMAHVAKSTVSKALNGQKGVSEENRKKILEIVEKVNFQPNANARALAQSKAGSIGLVLPHDAASALSGAYWSGITSAVAEAAAKHGCTLTVICTKNNENQDAHNLEMLLRRKTVDGFIIGAEQIEINEVNNIISSNTPFVFIGRNKLINHYSVDVNNKEGAAEVTKNLIQRGYKKIGCITGPAGYEYTIARLAGFSEVMKQHGLDDTKIVSTSYDVKAATRDVQRFIEKNPDLDAIFLLAGGDFVLNALDVLRLSGSNMNNIGLGVFDDSRIFDFLNWPIITARQPLYEIGIAAADLLFDLIEGKTPEKQTKCFNVDIILR